MKSFGAHDTFCCSATLDLIFSTPRVAKCGGKNKDRLDWKKM